DFGDARIELELAARVRQAAQQGVGDGARSADGDTETLCRTEQRQDDADRRAAEIVRPEVGVQRETGNNAPGRLAVELPPGITGPARRTGVRKTKEILGPQTCDAAH